MAGLRRAIEVSRRAVNAPPRRGSAYTLVELLVVIAVLGALIVLLMPAVQAAREAARRANCVSNQGQVVRAILNFEVAERSFPPGRIGCDTAGTAADGCPPNMPIEKYTAASGFISILPQIEQRPLFDQLDVAHGGLWNKNVDDLSWHYNQAKADGIQQRVELYVCPSDTSNAISDVYYDSYHKVLAATASYALVQGSIGPGSPTFPASKYEARYNNNGMFVYVHRRRAKQVTDGLTGTLFVGEVAHADTWASTNTWTYARVYADCLRTTANPLNTPPGTGEYRDGQQNAAFASYHPGGAAFAFGDGHVEFIEDGIDLWTYRALSTIAGEELVR